MVGATQVSTGNNIVVQGGQTPATLAQITINDCFNQANTATGNLVPSGGLAVCFGSIPNGTSLPSEGVFLNADNQAVGSPCTLNSGSSTEITCSNIPVGANVNTNGNNFTRSVNKRLGQNGTPEDTTKDVIVQPAANPLQGLNYDCNDTAFDGGTIDCTVTLIPGASFPSQGVYINVAGESTGAQCTPDANFTPGVLVCNNIPVGSTSNTPKSIEASEGNSINNPTPTGETVNVLSSTNPIAGIDLTCDDTATSGGTINCNGTTTNPFPSGGVCVYVQGDNGTTCTPCTESGGNITCNNIPVGDNTTTTPQDRPIFITPGTTRGGGDVDSGEEVRVETSLPRIISINPNNGDIAGGNQVTVTGVGFEGVGSLESILQVTARNGKGAAIKSDGTVWDFSNPNNATQVSGINNITNVSVGSSHTLALRNDGTVFAWGNNTFGQLGNGTLNTSSSPVQVSGLTNVRQVSAANNHSLALRNDGSVWAWGINNQYGVFGNGQTNTNASTPIQITTLTNIDSIYAATNHAAAIDSYGNVRTWGYGNYGQLGEGASGTSNIKTTPTLISSLSTNTDQLALSDLFSLALDSDTGISAFGYNSSGRLGDGTTTKRSTPVSVELSNVNVAFNGTPYAALTQITIDGNECTSLTVISDTEATCIVPAGSQVNIPVDVTGQFDLDNNGSNDLSDTLNDAYTYTTTDPTISSVTPNQGPTTGGTGITINGDNFPTDGTNVDATLTDPGNSDTPVACTNVVVVSSTQITCDTPAATGEGLSDVTVSVPGETPATSDDAFNYVNAPTVDSISPNQGPITGGTPITITGTGFPTTGTTPTVSFTDPGSNSQIPCSNVVVVSATEITCTTPAVTTPGGSTVTVTNPNNNTTGTSTPGVFTYTAANTGGLGCTNDNPYDNIYCSLPDQTLSYSPTLSQREVRGEEDLDVKLSGRNDVTSFNSAQGNTSETPVAVIDLTDTNGDRVFSDTDRLVCSFRLKPSVFGRDDSQYGFSAIFSSLTILDLNGNTIDLNPSTVGGIQGLESALNAAGYSTNSSNPNFDSINNNGYDVSIKAGYVTLSSLYDNTNGCGFTFPAASQTQSPVYAWDVDAYIEKDNGELIGTGQDTNSQAVENDYYFILSKYLFKSGAEAFLDSSAEALTTTQVTGSNYDITFIYGQNSNNLEYSGTVALSDSCKVLGTHNLTDNGISANPRFTLNATINDTPGNCTQIVTQQPLNGTLDLSSTPLSASELIQSNFDTLFNVVVN